MIELKRLRQGNSSVRTSLSILYLSTIWLLWGFYTPVGSFEGVPLYVPFSVIMLAVLGRPAILRAILLFVVLLLYELLKEIQPGVDITAKSIFGLGALAVILSTAYCAVYQVHSLSEQKLGRWFRYLLFTIAGLIVLDIILNFLGLKTSHYKHYFLPMPRFSGAIFSEPSFLALALSPFIFMWVYAPRKLFSLVGLWGGGALAFIVLTCPSATIFGIGGSALVVIVLRNIAKGSVGGVVIGTILLSAFTYSTLFVPEVSNRINGLFLSRYDAYENASVLAFVKGRQMAEYAILHFPLGVAFLDMRSLVPMTNVGRVSEFVYSLNSNDGASLLFKGVSELGLLFEIVLSLAIFRFMWGALVRRPERVQDVWILALQFAVFAHFLRGNSYFDGVVALGLSLAFFDAGAYAHKSLGVGSRSKIVDRRPHGSSRKA